MKRCFTHLLIVGSLALLSNQGFAHGRYILPSHTMTSAEKQETITIQSSISNDVFHPDMPLGNNDKGIDVNKKLSNVFSQLHPYVVTPDNQDEIPMSYQAFSRFSVSDLTLNTKGTHNLVIEQKPFVVTSFTHENGEPGREFGPGLNLPAGAQDIQRRQVTSRSEVFVSFNGLTKPQTQGKGLEITGQHPNDVFANEDVQFQLLFNGQPLTRATQVSLIREDTRHRNQREANIIDTDNNGFFLVSFAQAGFYLLEAQITQNSALDGVDIEQATLYLTLEVFPQ